MPCLDETVDVVFCIAQHAMAGTNGLLPHSCWCVNGGTYFGEGGMAMALAGYWSPGQEPPEANREACHVGPARTTAEVGALREGHDARDDRLRCGLGMRPVTSPQEGGANAPAGSVY